MIDYKKYFPYDTIRPEQEKALEEIVANWDDKKYFIIEAPVGSGKSGIAKTVANWSKNSFIVTETKQLQEQYVNDFKHENNMVSIKGKANYECNKNPRLNCENGPCSLSGYNNTVCKTTCKYFKTRDRALASKIVLTSYAYFFRAFGRNGVWKPRQTIMFDECHLIEDQLVSFASFDVDPIIINREFGIFDKLSKELYNEYMKPFTLDGWCEENKKRIKDIFALLAERRDELKADVEALVKSGDLKDADPEDLEMASDLYKSFSKIDNLFNKMSTFLSLNKDEWIIEVTSTGSLQFTPLYVNELFKKFCDNWAEKFVFLSATILDIDGFIKELGVDTDQCIRINLDSAFDPNKSPIYYMPCGNMSYANISQSLPRVTQVVDMIMDNKTAEKGIIHTGNYKVAAYIYENVKNNKRLLMKTSDSISNQNLFNAHSRSKNSILLSPSMTTGVDLKDDLARWQVVVKLPFDSLADKRIKRKSEEDPKWYAIQMLKTLIQACGRTTRSAEDFSTTYILDSSFKYWIEKYKEYLPSCYLDRIRGF